jgi:hypothetical protein
VTFLAGPPARQGAPVPDQLRERGCRRDRRQQIFLRLRVQVREGGAELRRREDDVKMSCPREMSFV